MKTCHDTDFSLLDLLMDFMKCFVHLILFAFPSVDKSSITSISAKGLDLASKCSCCKSKWKKEATSFLRRSFLLFFNTAVCRMHAVRLMSVMWRWSNMFKCQTTRLQSSFLHLQQAVRKSILTIQKQAKVISSLMALFVCVGHLEASDCFLTCKNSLHYV